MLDVTFVKRGGRSALGFLQATPLRVKGHTVQGAQGRLQADPRVLDVRRRARSTTTRATRRTEKRGSPAARSKQPQKLSVHVLASSGDAATLILLATASFRSTTTRACKC